MIDTTAPALREAHAPALLAHARALLDACASPREMAAQVVADVRSFGGGLAVAQRLAQANLITNKNLLPDDKPADWDRPSGLRMGTIEVTRLGMGMPEMARIADWIVRVLVERADPAAVASEVEAFRAGFQTLYYTFEEGLPPSMREPAPAAA